MASTRYILDGVATWAKIFPENVDEYNGVKKYSITLSMEDELADKFEGTGTRKVLKRGGDGKYQVKLTRPFAHPTFPELGGAPVVVDENGEPFKQLIGNGSKVSVEITVYDTKMGKGTRLDKVIVRDLVPYDGKEKVEAINLNSSNKNTLDKGHPFLMEKVYKINLVISSPTHTQGILIVAENEEDAKKRFQEGAILRKDFYFRIDSCEETDEMSVEDLKKTQEDTPFANDNTETESVNKKLH